ncbi:60S ribosomal protein L8B [Phlyctochytrium bullatum]|nr:60S ribosomal protein L8B [Phlyctochytrium bullatum]
MPPKAVSKAKKVAAAPGGVKKATKAPANPLIEKNSRNFSIGANIQPKRDLTRFVKWPEYVRLQRQKAILKQRLKVPPAINQFTKTLDKNTATQAFKLLAKYRPETKVEKKARLSAAAEKVAAGGKVDAGKKPVFVKYGINHITALVEAKKAQLVLIAHDVDPIEIVLWLPALCRKMGVPYAIVKSKSRLGTVVHKKTATALAITEVRPEDKAELASLVSAVKLNYNDKAEEIRRQWGGGIMGAKSVARTSKRLKAIAAEQAGKQMSSSSSQIPDEKPTTLLADVVGTHLADDWDRPSTDDLAAAAEPNEFLVCSSGTTLQINAKLTLLPNVKQLPGQPPDPLDSSDAALLAVHMPPTLPADTVDVRDPPPAAAPEAFAVSLLDAAPAPPPPFIIPTVLVPPLPADLPENPFADPATPTDGSVSDDPDFVFLHTGPPAPSPPTAAWRGPPIHRDALPAASPPAPWHVESVVGNAHAAGVVDAADPRTPSGVEWDVERPPGLPGLDPQAVWRGVPDPWRDDGPPPEPILEPDNTGPDDRDALPAAPPSRRPSSRPAATPIPFLVSELLENLHRATGEVVHAGAAAAALPPISVPADDDTDDADEATDDAVDAAGERDAAPLVPPDPDDVRDAAAHGAEAPRRRTFANLAARAAARRTRTAGPVTFLESGVAAGWGAATGVPAATHAVLRVARLPPVATLKADLLARLAHRFDRLRCVAVDGTWRPCAPFNVHPHVWAGTVEDVGAWVDAWVGDAEGWWRVAGRPAWRVGVAADGAGAGIVVVSVGMGVADGPAVVLAVMSVLADSTGEWLRGVPRGLAPYVAPVTPRWSDAVAGGARAVGAWAGGVWSPGPMAKGSVRTIRVPAVREEVIRAAEAHAVDLMEMDVRNAEEAAGSPGFWARMWGCWGWAAPRHPAAKVVEEAVRRGVRITARDVVTSCVAGAVKRCGVSAASAVVPVFFGWDEGLVEKVVGEGGAGRLDVDAWEDEERVAAAMQSSWSLASQTLQVGDTDPLLRLLKSALARASPAVESAEARANLSAWRAFGPAWRQRASQGAGADCVGVAVVDAVTSDDRPAWLAGCEVTDVQVVAPGFGGRPQVTAIEYRDRLYCTVCLTDRDDGGRWDRLGAYLADEFEALAARLLVEGGAIAA